jgi:hypothetical protein
MTLLTLGLRAVWDWVVNAKPQLLYPQKRASIPIVQKARLASQVVKSGTEHRASSIGVRAPDRSSRNE